MRWPAAAATCPLCCRYASHALDVTPDGIVAYAGHYSVPVLCTKSRTVLHCLGPHKSRCGSSAASGRGGADAALPAADADRSMSLTAVYPVWRSWDRI